MLVSKISEMGKEFLKELKTNNPHYHVLQVSLSADSFRTPKEIQQQDERNLHTCHAVASVINQLSKQLTQSVKEQECTVFNVQIYLTT